MSYTFEEIMAFHPGNIMVYNKIKNLLIGNKLVPFIGAGLTKFAYYLWSDLLKELSKMLTNTDNIAEVEALIDAGKCMEAADELENLHGKSALKLYLADLLSPNKLEQKWDQLPKEAISLLPHLFKELVITTNYDNILETVYEIAGYPFDWSFLPGHTGLLNRLRREGGARVLYKLHGTIVGEHIDYERFVFTKSQYDKHYDKNSPLTKELKEYFEDKVMLFLGCSLNNDRTMELLQEVIESGIESGSESGIDYYTIISCKLSERDEKIRQLGDKHICAILYEGDRHEAVRVILEHLLEETDQVAYKALHYHVGALKQMDSLKRFSYDSDFIPFTGRKEELKQLNDFLEDPNVPFRWWAVTGPGGSGKSRLVYEFQKDLPHGWTARYLKRSDYTNLSSLTAETTQKKLLIADYVQEHAKEIGAWMEQLNETPRSLPIRVLLVERDADDNQDNALLTESEADDNQDTALLTEGETDDNQDNTAWTKLLYEKTFHEEELKSACYKEDFLKLQPLGDVDLLKIIENYAEKLNKKALTDTNKQMLLKKLKSVDRGLCRPLYAMFLTDAYVEGDDPERWDKSTILNYVTKREQKRLQFNILQAIGTPDKTLYNACLHLLSMATVLQDASLSELQQLCPDLWKTVEERAKKNDAVFESPADMLEQVGLAVNGQVLALRPDLIGEYYAYTWLLEHRKKAPERIKGFLSAVWQKPASTKVFFDRLFKDYKYLLNESADCWKLILPKDIPLSESIAEYYARTLVSATLYCKIVNECERQVDMQETIAQKHPNNLNIAKSFANGLVNLSYKLDEQSKLETVDRLESLANEHKDVAMFVLQVAKGLVNLSKMQNEHDAIKTVVRIGILMKRYEYLPEIAILFTKGQFNLSLKQDEQGAKKTVDRLDSLATEHPNVPEIASWFALGLFALSIRQDECATQGTVDRLNKLVTEYPNVSDIALLFAGSLALLSYKQDEQETGNTIAMLESFTNENPGVPDFAVWIDNGLIKLSDKQTEDGAKELFNRTYRLIQFLKPNLQIYKD